MLSFSDSIASGHKNGGKGSHIRKEIHPHSISLRFSKSTLEITKDIRNIKSHIAQASSNPSSIERLLQLCSCHVVQCENLLGTCVAKDHWRSLTN